MLVFLGSCIPASLRSCCMRSVAVLSVFNCCPADGVLYPVWDLTANEKAGRLLGWLAGLPVVFVMEATHHAPAARPEPLSATPFTDDWELILQSSGVWWALEEEEEEEEGEVPHTKSVSSYLAHLLSSHLHNFWPDTYQIMYLTHLAYHSDRGIQKRKLWSLR